MLLGRLGASYRHVVAAWGCLGAVLGHLGALLGRPWGGLGAVLSHLVASWGGLKTVLGRFGPLLDGPCALLELIFHIPVASERPTKIDEKPVVFLVLLESGGALAAR